MLNNNNICKLRILFFLNYKLCILFAIIFVKFSKIIFVYKYFINFVFYFFLNIQNVKNFINYLQ